MTMKGKSLDDISELRPFSTCYACSPKPLELQPIPFFQPLDEPVYATIENLHAPNRPKIATKPKISPEMKINFTEQQSNDPSTIE